MFICKTSLFFIVLNIFLTFVQAEKPSDRAHHDCVLLDTKIYCYGGAIRRLPSDSDSFDSGNEANEAISQSGLFYSLDVSKPSNVSTLNNNWSPIDTNIGPNYYFAMAAIPSRNSFILTGGRGHSKDQQLSVLYDVNNNIWKNETDSDLRDFYDSHTAVAKDDLVYIGGGRRIVGTNLTVDEIFPQNIRILRFDARYWRSPKATLSRLSIDIRLHHKSVLGSDGKTIYYVGGMYTAPPDPVSYDDYRYEYVPMNSILTFDTDSETWNNITTEGLIPSGRIDHSLTLKPHTNELILYGGVDTGTINLVRDYFYILNLDTMTWSNTTLNTTPGVDQGGPLYGHAAVLVGDSLFFIFGCNDSEYQQVNNYLHVLNVSSYTWIESVPGAEAQQKIISPPNDDDKSLTVGAIAGIVVGCVAAISIIAGLIVFFVLRKKRQLNRGDTIKSDAYEDKNIIELPIEYSNNSTPNNFTANTTKASWLAPYRTGSRKPDGATTIDSNSFQRSKLSPVKPDLHL